MPRLVDEAGSSLTFGGSYSSSFVLRFASTGGRSQLKAGRGLGLGKPGLQALGDSRLGRTGLKAAGGLGLWQNQGLGGSRPG